MKRSPSWLSLSICGLLFRAGALTAQQVPRAATPSIPAPSSTLQRRDNNVPTIETAARLVLLDVVVTDGKGNPVKGLKPSDFTLLEDGVPQILSSFKEHQALTPAQAAQADAAVKLPPNHFTNYDPAVNESAATVFLLDALDTPIQAQMYLRDQMIAYMKTVPPGARIAIFQLDTQLHMIQDFTSDRSLLQQVVAGKRNQPKISPLLGGPYASSYVRQQMRQDILTQSMQNLARYLAPFPGRKNLIWFTASVPLALYGPGLDVPFPDITSFIDEFSKTTDVLTLSRIAVYPIDSRGLQTDPAFSAANSRGAGYPNRFETRQFYQHGDLDDVAEATGGKAFYNTNGLRQAIAEIVDTGSNFYTLSYTPTNRLWDGSYRKLQVKLAAQGLHLEYRRGYFARNDQAAENQHIAQLRSHRKPLPLPAGLKAPSPVMDAAMAMGAAPSRDIIFVAGITPASEVSKPKHDEPLPKDNFLEQKFRSQPYRVYNIHYSVNANTIQLMPTPDEDFHGRLEFIAVLYDDMGQVINSKITQAPIDVDNISYQQMIRSGLGTVQSIAIPVKGNYFLRLGIHDVQADKAGTLEIPVDRIKLSLPEDAATKH